MPRPLLRPMAKTSRMSKLFFRLLAASWRRPALLKTVLSSTRWPRFAETPAAVYAPWALVLKASQNTVCQRGSAKIDLMSRAFWQVADLPKRPRHRAPVYAPGRVGPKPRLPSTRNGESVLPSTRRGGVWEKDAMSRVLGLVLEAPGPPGAALKIAST